MSKTMSDQRCFDVIFPRWFNVSLLSGEGLST